MRRTDPNHTSVCKVCWQGTWYAPTAIEVSPRTRDKQAFVTKPESWAYGNKAHEHGVPGAMNLMPIDRSSLAPAFAGYYESGDRIKVRTTYPSGETFERTGTVSRTTGWRPSYMLMHRSNAHGSWDLLDGDDQVIAVKRGREYVNV